MHTIINFFLSLAIVFSSTVFAQTKVNQLAEGVFQIFDNYYSSLLIINGEDVLISDPAWSARAETLKQEIKKLTDQPVNKVLLTHEHYDHVGGSEVFEGAEIICHENCMDVFALDELGMVPKVVDVTFSDNLTLNVGEIPVELHYFGPGDGVATTVIYLPQQKILQTADLYDPFTLTNANFMDDKNYLGVRKIFNQIKDWDIEHAVNGHSESTDPKDLIAAMGFVEALYQATSKQVITAYETGNDPWQLLDTLPNELELPEYESWENYQDLPKHTFRMLQSILHGG